MKILLGFYYGIGDFVSSVPIVRELSKRYDITIAIGNQNKGLINLVDLENVQVLYFPLFSLKKIKEVSSFIDKLKRCKFDRILVSPHVQDAVTSWKIPLMLKYIKSSNTKIIGASSDKNSFLYDILIPIDKSIPLMQREIDFVKLTGLVDMSDNISIDNIFNLKSSEKKDLVVIHPGASKDLREWKLDYYNTLSSLLMKNTCYELLFIGLEKELMPIRNSIKQNDRISYFSGSFEKVINKALKSKVIITMDSGFGHIASALKLNHLVLIGSANPQHIKPIFSNTKILNFKKLSCQPCNGHRCHVGHNYCMDLITPQLVYHNIIECCNQKSKIQN